MGESARPYDAVNALLGFKPTQLGSRKTLKPAIGLPNMLNSQLHAQEEKAVDIAFADGIARAVTCTLVNRSIPNPATTQAINTGPIVGVVEWGTGGGFSRIEFNLPLAYTWSQNGDIVPGTGSIEGTNSALLTVSASAIRIMARNESRLPPIYNPSGAGSIGPSSTTLNGEFEGFIGQGTSDKQCGSLERCLVVVSSNSDALAPTGAVNFGIPRFAKAVRFFRTPIGTQLGVNLAGSFVGSQMGEFQINPGSVGFIEIPPMHDVIQIVNRSSQNIASLYAAFVLSL